MTASILMVIACAFGPGDSVSKLSDADAEVRDKAYLELDLRRQELENGLLEQLRRVLDDRDRDYLGRTHTVLQAIASTLAENTVPDLVEAVDFTLDPDTFPIGGFLATSNFYPVAETLRTIGSKRVITEILTATANKPRDDKVLRVYAWILIEIIGKDGARVIVERGRIRHVPRKPRETLRLLKMIDEPASLQMPPQKPPGNGKPAPAR